MKRLKSIVVSCGVSFVTPKGWVYTVSQVHTCVIVLFSRLRGSTTEIGILSE